MVDDKCLINRVKISDIPTCAMTNITEIVDEIFLNPEEEWKVAISKQDSPYYLMGTLVCMALSLRIAKKIKLI